MSKGRQKFSSPPASKHSLALIAGPLGNRGDVTTRALEKLRESDLIFCEDTRKMLPLLKDWGIDASSKKLISLPGQAEQETDFNRYLDYSRWVFMSDAGTPIVNDPGAALLAWARRQDIAVEALPGPCAPILLWQWTGGFGLPFCFAGFVPKSKNDSDFDSFFAPAHSQGGTFCFFDTRHQVLNTLDYLSRHETWKNEKLFIGREMTKTFEELLCDVPAMLRSVLETRIEKNEGVGELTLLLPSKLAAKKSEFFTLEDLVAIRQSTPKDAAKILSKLTGQSVKSCYDRLIEK